MGASESSFIKPPDWGVRVGKVKLIGGQGGCYQVLHTHCIHCFVEIHKSCKNSKTNEWYSVYDGQY